jgi:hypothetical protein
MRRYAERLPEAAPRNFRIADISRSFAALRRLRMTPKIGVTRLGHFPMAIGTDFGSRTSAGLSVFITDWNHSSLFGAPPCSMR